MRTSSEASDIAIEVEGLSKRYQISAPGTRHDTLRDMVAGAVGGLLRGGRGSGRQTFWALNDVSFTIRNGENVGILGLNGAGKSTLLKLLSRVTYPTVGRAHINGRLGSLLEVGTGFHPELTGRENVFLYGAILGMGREEIASKFDDIVAFAEIGDFIETPVKRYSSGMYVRLAFSVAAHLQPDILLLDEVLSVGDLPFQRKCIEFAKSLQRRNATILFVSHNMFSIKTMCDRVIYLRQGRVVFDGPTDKGIELYEADCRLSSVPWASGIDPDSSPIAVKDVAIMNEAGQPTSVLDHGERLRIRLDYEIRGEVEEPNFIVSLIRSDDVACCNYNTTLDKVTLDTTLGVGRLELLTPPLRLVSELYKIEILVREKGFGKLICAQTGAGFHVRDPLLDLHFGVFHEAGTWTCGEQRTPASSARQMGAIA